jgi:hypothetical protein
VAGGQPCRFGGQAAYRDGRRRLRENGGHGGRRPSSGTRRGCAGRNSASAGAPEVTGRDRGGRAARGVLARTLIGYARSDPAMNSTPIPGRRQLDALALCASSPAPAWSRTGRSPTVCPRLAAAATRLANDSLGRIGRRGCKVELLLGTPVADGPTLRDRTIHRGHCPSAPFDSAFGRHARIVGESPVAMSGPWKAALP